MNRLSKQISLPTTVQAPCNQDSHKKFNRRVAPRHPTLEARSDFFLGFVDVPELYAFVAVLNASLN